MSVRPEVFQAILLLGLASLACRLGGFFLMRYVSITPRVDAWLRAIPIALIGAILGPIAVNGGPPEWLGDRSVVERLSIDRKGILSVRYLTHRDADRDCCPTLRIDDRYRVENEQLVGITK